MLAIGRPEMPSWMIGAHDPESAGERFAAQSWILREKDIVSKFDASVFPLRSLVRYYSNDHKRRLAGDFAEQVYSQLEKTDFPSLYAATNVHDDFAESFVTYVHTELLKKPWVVRGRAGDRVLFEVKPCWNLPRCRAKRKALEAILASEAAVSL